MLNLRTDDKANQAEQRFVNLFEFLSVRRRELKASEWKVVNLLTYLVCAHHDAPARAFRQLESAILLPVPPALRAQPFKHYISAP